MIAMDIARASEIMGTSLCYLFVGDNPHAATIFWDHFCDTGFWIPLMPVRFSALNCSEQEFKNRLRNS